MSASLVVWVVLVLALASVPPVSRDALTHHLAVPKLWIQHGGIYEIPEIPFSYYPQLLDLLYVLPLYWHMDYLAKIFHFAFALMTAALIAFYLRRRVGAAWAMVGGMLFLTIPLILKLSITVYVDLGLTFFSTAALLSVLGWLASPERRYWMILGGVCAGFALSTKYNALVSFTSLALVLALFSARRRSVERAPGRMRWILVFFVMALLVYSPWPIRNYVLTGNPIYPLHQAFFVEKNKTGGESPEKETENDQKTMGPLLARRLVYDENLSYTLLIPLRIFFEGRDDDPRRFDGRLHPLLLILPLLLLLRPVRAETSVPSWEMGALALYSVLIVLYTMFTTDMRVRYVVTIVPPLVILSIYALRGLDGWLRRKAGHPRLRQGAMGLLLLLLFLPNLGYALQLWRKVDPVPLLLGRVDREEYISGHLGDYAMVQLANRVVPATGKVLGVYLGGRRYYFDVPVTLSSELLWRLGKKSRSADELADSLREQGITHILVRYDLFDHSLSGKPAGLRQVILGFFNNRTSLLGMKNGFGLYEVR